MAFIAPIVAIATAAAAIGPAIKGVESLVSGGGKKGKGSSVPTPAAGPAAPAPQASLDQAAQDAATKRKTILASGGQTDITGPTGGGLLSAANVAKKSLLGS